VSSCASHLRKSGLGYRAYTADPPIAAQVRTTSGQVVYTGPDVIAGQKLFLRHGLMEYGSIFGHGAYLGPDFTADYLHRAALIATREYGGDTSSTARDSVVADFKTNRYDAKADRVTISDAQAVAFRELVAHYTDYFGAQSAENGPLPEAITDPVQVKQLTAYFAWSAWAGSTLRPDKDYSYTNNWPPEKLVGNVVTADVVVWSVLSLVVLLAGIGVLFAAFGRWGERLGWRGRQADTISFRPPGEAPWPRRRAPSGAAGTGTTRRPPRQPAARTRDRVLPGAAGRGAPGRRLGTARAPAYAEWPRARPSAGCVPPARPCPAAPWVR